MITLCINPQACYLMVWRGQRRTGAHFWITPASMARLMCLIARSSFKQTAIVGGEHWMVQHANCI